MTNGVSGKGGKGNQRADLETGDQLNVLGVLISLIDRKQYETAQKERETQRHVDSKRKRDGILLLVKC
eukprot:m.343176 g.343176  ORF g.343176 m.343176 type:complete len:68 (-) comp27867_c0_seq3:4046-4249(-)